MLTAPPFTAQRCPLCEVWIYVADGPFAEENDPTKPLAYMLHWEAEHASEESLSGASVGIPFAEWNEAPVSAVRVGPVATAERGPFRPGRAATYDPGWQATVWNVPGDDGPRRGPRCRTYAAALRAAERMLASLDAEGALSPQEPERLTIVLTVDVFNQREPARFIHHALSDALGEMAYVRLAESGWAPDPDAVAEGGGGRVVHIAPREASA